ncbi:uncharacterized protein VTP21DRAFT_9691 [Calcarisporiella thermophila]|uniref:uncharacterized protein n=1 Tax=Calcarisporiella thermophila TaxID=911321 RepID=UPI0037439B64
MSPIRFICVCPICQGRRLVCKTTLWKHDRLYIKNIRDSNSNHSIEIEDDDRESLGQDIISSIVSLSIDLENNSISAAYSDEEQDIEMPLADEVVSDVDSKYFSEDSADTSFTCDG